MIVIQYINPGEDCPAEIAGSETFRNNIIRITRERLQLGRTDTVVVKFGKLSDFPESKVITI